MSKKLVFSKASYYKYNKYDNTRKNRAISNYGTTMFADVDWRLYDDGTVSKAGINALKHLQTNKHYRKANKKNWRFT